VPKIRKIADWDLEDYFPNDNLFQEFLELFEREYDTDYITRTANEFMEEHGILLKFAGVDLKSNPDQFEWYRIIDDKVAVGWQGIYAEGMSWSLHRHPKFYYKTDDNGITHVTDITYEWAMFNRMPGDRVAETVEEMALIMSYHDNLKRKFNQLS